jgi:Domain of unknown function (DUF6457)
VTRDEWISSFAREAGVRPASVQEISQLLDLAGVAAHASERTAAPLACWIAGSSSLSLPELLAIAERIGTPGRASSDAAQGDPREPGGSVS